MLELHEYITENNRAPYTEWLKSLDRAVKARVLTRVDRVRRGNFGDTKSVGDGVFELRMDFGPGYRVYYGMQGDTLVILLCAGDKDSQSSDIMKAKKYWHSLNLGKVKHGQDQKLQGDARRSTTRPA